MSEILFLKIMAETFSLPFILVAYSLTFYFQHRAEWIREYALFENMLKCTFCTGFHAGWITFIMLFHKPWWRMVENEFIQSIWVLFLVGLVSSSTIYILDAIIGYLEKKGE